MFKEMIDASLICFSSTMITTTVFAFFHYWKKNDCQNVSYDNVLLSLKNYFLVIYFKER